VKQKLFVLTARNPEAGQHLSDSIENPIHDEKSLDFFGELDHE
jgi:hypothetical protein